MTTRLNKVISLSILNNVISTKVKKRPFSLLTILFVAKYKSTLQAFHVSTFKFPRSGNYFISMTVPL
jgi:hypothetical protein